MAVRDFTRGSTTDHSASGSERPFASVRTYIIPATDCENSVPRCSYFARVSRCLCRCRLVNPLGCGRNAKSFLISENSLSGEKSSDSRNLFSVVSVSYLPVLLRLHLLYLLVDPLLLRNRPSRNQVRTVDVTISKDCELCHFNSCETVDSPLVLSKLPTLSSKPRLPPSSASPRSKRQR